jgi:hypothetical protein
MNHIYSLVSIALESGNYREYQFALKRLSEYGYRLKTAVSVPKGNAKKTDIEYYLRLVYVEVSEPKPIEPKTIKQGCQSWVEFKAYLMAIFLGTYYMPMGLEFAL